MEKKQSSIDWLAQAIYDKMKMRGDGKVFQGILDKAKHMHKEEIEETFFQGAYGGDIISAEQYYNETFGGEQC